jgi:hypothetical protein
MNLVQQFFSLLSWCLFRAQHVSGYFPPIIRSSMTAMAASDFTFVSWRQSCCVRGRAGRPARPVFINVTENEMPDPFLLLLPSVLLPVFSFRRASGPFHPPKFRSALVPTWWCSLEQLFGHFLPELLHTYPTNLNVDRDSAVGIATS